MSLLGVVALAAVFDWANALAYGGAGLFFGWGFAVNAWIQEALADRAWRKAQGLPALRPTRYLTLLISPYHVMAYRRAMSKSPESMDELRKQAWLRWPRARSSPKAFP